MNTRVILGLWHYERIHGRDNGREFRVADENDDVITDFVTEEQAQDFVRAHNAVMPDAPKTWRY